ncbi:mediator of RNA polymerase II transcription subunit 8 isoform X2 [Phoca vitulina]|uniref:mediator of RNA polymerase II transcription subunit 8 isoform X2 n=1 Tax=Phoca vitulina TaxID=9720 RepID=UPI001395ECA4|nr:mediator of RNA polymerase II transcription subunit 8 isoform X2 [Phoca vitulina]
MALWVTNLFLSVQREEKQLEASLDALLSQVADLKNSLGSFIYKLENEYDRLTCFALLSGQLNTLNKVLKHEKTPLFRNQVIIPLVLSPDRDEDLMRQTEGRVPVFSHEVVPDHLRTKPDPEVEEQEKQLTTDAARVGADAAQKQIQSLNKMCSNLLEKISKEERESESGGLRPNKQTFNPADTNALVAAVAFGKGLSNWRPSGSSGPGQPGQPGAGTILAGASGLQQVQMAGAPSQQQPLLSGVQMAQTGQTGKMPSGIKTNIKSASMHPYQRVPSWVGLRRTEDVLVALVDSHWRSQNEAERQEEARCTSGEPGPAQGDPMEPAARCRGKGWGVLAGRASCPGIWRPAPAPAPRAEPSRGQSAGAPRPARPVPLW